MSDIEVTEDEAFEQLARRLDEALQDNARLAAENERQKSEWQAEAVESVLMIINDYKVMLDKIKHCQYIEALDDIRDDVQAVAESYRRQAQPFTAAREWVKSVEDDV